MAAEAHGKSGSYMHSHEALTEQELQELDAESIQNEIEAELEEAAEEEAEADPEDIAEEATEMFEEAEDRGYQHAMSPRFRGLVTRFFLRQFIKAVLIYTKAVVRRMHANTSLRKKLNAASKRGPRAVRALLAPAILRAMPRPFRRTSRRLLPLVIRLSFRYIARMSGLNALETDTADTEY